MTRLYRQFLFHLKEFSTTPYFIQLVVVGTLSASIIQRLGVRAWGADSYEAFLRSFMIGMWGSCTAAAGIIGFERQKGTLIYLLSGRENPLLAVMTVVMSTSAFGLISLPLSFCLWIIPGTSAISTQTVIMHLPQIIIGSFLLWLSTTVVTLVIASVFILTPHATTYESLILVPALFCSGVFTGASRTPAIVNALRFIFPPTSSVHFLYLDSSSIYHGTFLLDIGLCIATSLLWIIIAYFLGKAALRRAQVDGTLEVF
ncbi:ABC-2 type transport system permease protein [Bifidobacterium bohemicum]|uniref:ABC-type multidrug transport system, permease protein n=1 Tax=Bifidobacterium bohemicum DSM 22767 TaxID=1437606 RepID=A0A086ZFK2_9BIFI|nr:hypothetical protein [Bifidobacterium bohemicum]KFI45302.1 ABC-type multidrug transport system, permease protein [Bifidobacterium bohemicum DSM 22767]SCC20080.1 ABC-2 type transport system permease protein [Bifidobacterium bohemicum]